MSEPRVRFYGNVVNGVRQYNRPLQHQALLKHIEVHGGQFEESIMLRFEDETKEQHGYYRGGIIVATCMQTDLFDGWLKEDIHEHFAKLFLTTMKRKELHKKDGTIEVSEFPHTESTGDLGKKRMSEFIDKVLNYLAEYEIYPLTPQEYYYGKYKTQIDQEKS